MEKRESDSGMFYKIERKTEQEIQSIKEVALYKTRPALASGCEEDCSGFWTLLMLLTKMKKLCMINLNYSKMEN